MAIGQIGYEQDARTNRKNADSQLRHPVIANPADCKKCYMRKFGCRVWQSHPASFSQFGCLLLWVKNWDARWDCFPDELGHAVHRKDKVATRK